MAKTTKPLSNDDLQSMRNVGLDLNERAFFNGVERGERLMRENGKPFCRACMRLDWERSSKELRQSSGNDFVSAPPPEHGAYCGDSLFMKVDESVSKDRRTGLVVRRYETFRCRRFEHVIVIGRDVGG